jgi:lipopolysaccharide transport system ATP-binding protein
MQVRLAFAVAAHLEPEILIVDEVLAVGDAAFQKKCLGKMSDVAKEGRTVLFVSHNMDAVRKLCTYAYLLAAGQKNAAGQTDKIIDRYLAAGTSAESAAVSLPPGSPEAPAAASRLTFQGQNGSAQAQFKLWEPWKIMLEFEVYEPTDSFMAAVGPVRWDGVPIVTYWSKPQDLAPGL